jgi:hypothetical protein
MNGLMRQAIVVSTVLLGGLLGGSRMNAQMHMKFPSIEGKALTGSAFRAPEDFGKKRNLVIVAFLREQQKDVDTWIPRLESLADSSGEFAFYEFPVLEKMNPVTRFFIYRGMRSGIDSERARARTVTFHIDKGAFKAALGIVDEGVIRLFLVGPRGDVLWQSSGTWSSEKESSLRESVGSP